MTDFKGAEHLLMRLAGERDKPKGRKVVFLVGSALTMPHGGRPGVANVADMVSLVREKLGRLGTELESRRKLRDFDAKQAKVASKYQHAFDELKAVAGPEALNEVVRAGVLRARKASAPAVDPESPEALREAEKNEADWHLGPGVKALGLLLAHHPERFAPTVLTTNFDPLVKLAVQAAGGRAHGIEFRGDASFGVEDPGARVVHLHGSWRGDTWHSVAALTHSRPTLIRSLAGLFENVTLVVMGYGGWDDVIMDAVAELGLRGDAKPDVVWCFYDRDPGEIAKKYPKVLERLSKLGERASCYAGIDCNEVLPTLRARMDEEHELLGRRDVCRQLLEAIEGTRAVEILGERMMGRSTLLEWVAKLGREYGKPVALIRAREVNDPVSLVRKVGEALGRSADVRRKLDRVAAPTDSDASHALEVLRGAWILVDDADELARAGNGFTEHFFSALRDEVQKRTMLWVSVSKIPLGPRFRSCGLVSRFLNDSTQVFAGALGRREIEVALRARVGSRATDVGAQVGTLPLLVYRVCDADDLDARLRDLASWAASPLEWWWERDAGEQALLRRAAAEALRRDGLSEDERTTVASLCARGLMVETEDGYRLNGGAWRDHVAGK